MAFASQNIPYMVKVLGNGYNDVEILGSKMKMVYRAKIAYFELIVMQLLQHWFQHNL